MTVTAAELYTCITNSIIRYGEDFRKANLAASTYFDWDAHAQLSDLPQTDVLGPAGIGLTNDGNLTEVVWSYGLATVNDINLFRLRKTMSGLYGSLQPEQVIPVYAPNGDRFSWLVVRSPVTIAPVSRSEIRAIQFISLQALLDPHAASST